MSSFTTRKLGQTGLEVGRLGVASSYGAPARAFEEAFEKGCNYFYWGSLRKSGMRDAIRNISARGRRDQLVVAIQSYSRSPSLMEYFFNRALKSLGLEQVEVLLLGWYNARPTRRILDKALELREKGLYRFLALSGHNRPLFPQLAQEDLFDIFHIRYNAAHRGAEVEVFNKLDAESRPGIVTYTATSWTQLLNPKNMPNGEPALRAADCYRFVLSNPMVDVCMCGPKDAQQMNEALSALDLGPFCREDLERIKRIGDHVRTRARKFI